MSDNNEKVLSLEEHIEFIDNKFDEKLVLINNQIQEKKDIPF